MLPVSTNLRRLRRMVQERCFTTVMITQISLGSGGESYFLLLNAFQYRRIGFPELAGYCIDRLGFSGVT